MIAGNTPDPGWRHQQSGDLALLGSGSWMLMIKRVRESEMASRVSSFARTVIEREARQTGRDRRVSLGNEIATSLRSSR